MNKIAFLTLSILTLVFSCKPSESQITKNKNFQKKEITKADKILSQALLAHGGAKYDNAHYQFIFRKNKYTFHNNKEGSNYTATYNKEGKITLDKLVNNTFTRTTNGNKVTLSERDKSRFSGGLNSVIYFATLPHKLLDPAVNKSYKGETTIKGKKYEVLEITFNQEGGGQDHDDEFHYWINKETHRIDYLAYNYTVNKGGVRFRSAYNPRMVDGILFQDYVNYKAPVGTPLSELPVLLEKDELKKLSVIETEDVVNLNK